MNVLSLFDGISACRVALDKNNIKVNKYYSSEIDKFAIQISKKNYPNSIHLGNILNWENWKINYKNIDLVAAGFPCQSWSGSGKQEGDKTKNGMLFWVMCEVMKNVLKHNKDVKIFIENVKMKKEFEEYITSNLQKELKINLDKYLIDSCLVSAQSRKRLYWTNIKGITQPEDKNINIESILEKDSYETKDIADQHYSLKTLDAIKNTNSILCTQIGGSKQYKNNVRKNKAYTLIASRPNGIIFENKEYRKFTELECERLQGLSDNYTEGVSKTQRYKMIGNSWQVDTITHMFKYLN